MGIAATTAVLVAPFVVGAGADSVAPPVGFRQDVMAVLSKAGCNQGVCHGNQNGKGGFKLSLRGEDPAFDYKALTRDSLGRRANRQRPGASLLLLKATAQVPHEGGKRFATIAPEYDVLARWIADGLPADLTSAPSLLRLKVKPPSQILFDPNDRAQLHVHAHFSNGVVRDVTRWAVYEPSNTVVVVSGTGEARRQRMGETSILVRYLDQRSSVQLAFVPARTDFQWRDVPAVNLVDQHVFAKLKALRVQPSELCSDAAFLRRAYLDALGILPTVGETRKFLEDQRSDKRNRLINHLLQRPEFGDYWALKWADLLRVEEKVLDRKGVAVFHNWIRQRIAAGQPLNEFARELIAARGSTYAQPATNFYRALRDPEARAEATTQVFLGTRLRCARCHNHPFDRWTQDDYYGFAAWFARINYRIVENRSDAREHQYTGEQIVFASRQGELAHGRTGAVSRPRFLGGAALADDQTDRQQALADWLARPDNGLFAQAQVNRIWYHLMGRGIVDPIDDFRLSNPPVNGPLLEALGQDFIRHRHDVRHTIRTIMNSRTYQLSAVANETNRDDETNFARTVPRPLPAEALLDSLSEVLGVSAKFAGYPSGTRAAQLPGVQWFHPGAAHQPTAAEKFLKAFGKPARQLTCECERRTEPAFSHALQLLTGEFLNELLSYRDNRIGRLLAARKPDRKIIEELYTAALCRLPAEPELRALIARTSQARDRRAALEDVAWGIVTSREFWLRH